MQHLLQTSTVQKDKHRDFGIDSSRNASGVPKEWSESILEAIFYPDFSILVSWVESAKAWTPTVPVKRERARETRKSP
ncbi:hypothetical protein Q31b_05840 [Novipirellula aureliae]|uniref:Uncharacterized protein n=1 Tax=Novipirellula aureliae TaxID=2527966 RepID=A0A5C6E8U3_9BACT|nr:hypothetical protein Q31b_05840 [Novipirellula aureliae]